MRIEVDRDRCISNGRCLRVAPAVFDWDRDGIAYVKDERAAAADPEAVRSAELGCPSRAIRAEHIGPSPESS